MALLRGAKEFYQEPRNYCGDVCAKRPASDTDALQFPLRTHRDDQAVDSTAEASRWLIATASQNGEHMTPALSRVRQ